MDYTVHGILQARKLEWVAYPFSRGSSQPRDQTQISRIADFLPAKPQGKPKNTGVGSLSPLQHLFLTQDLLHCRKILNKFEVSETILFSHLESSYPTGGFGFQSFICLE